MEAAPAQGTSARYVTPVHRGTEGGHVFPQVDRRRFFARKLWNIDVRDRIPIGLGKRDELTPKLKVGIEQYGANESNHRGM
jgi:hypothetical protein